MGYDIYLLRKEVKEQNTEFDFLEKEELITKFTEEQFEKLKTRLLAYGYKITNEELGRITFNYKGGLHGISILLTKSILSFSSGFTDNGVFEIGMTTSEFTDSGEFVKLDLQVGGWEELDYKTSPTRDATAVRKDQIKSNQNVNHRIINKIDKKEEREKFEAWVATMDERILVWLQGLSQEEVNFFDYSIESLDEIEKYLFSNFTLEDLKSGKIKVTDSPIDAALSYIMKVFSIQWKSRKFRIELEDERSIIYKVPAITTDPAIGMDFSPYRWLRYTLKHKEIGRFRKILESTKRNYIEQYGDTETPPA